MSKMGLNNYEKRREQLERYEAIESAKMDKTNEKVKSNQIRVKFPDSCIFLAACASKQTEEVEEILKNFNTDINTSNVDGLTGLHIACINEDLKMVEYLIDKGIRINLRDNEGWTALHAAAQSGLSDITRLLIEKGSRLDMVNCDRELPIDLAEKRDVRNIILKAMKEKGIDEKVARNCEEKLMMEDALKHEGTQVFCDHRDEKTGATPLHISAVKGYLGVMKHLLKHGANVDAVDNDGWTPLHAAAHWAQAESCRLLVHHYCNMNLPNKCSSFSMNNEETEFLQDYIQDTNFKGNTAMDVADPAVVPLLEELQENQKARPASPTQLIRLASKRKSSITRISMEQKKDMQKKNEEEERAILDDSTISTDKDNIFNQVNDPLAKEVKTDNMLCKIPELSEVTTIKKGDGDSDKVVIVSNKDEEKKKEEAKVVEKPPKEEAAALRTVMKEDVESKVRSPVVLRKDAVKNSRPHTDSQNKNFQNILSDLQRRSDNPSMWRLGFRRPSNSEQQEQKDIDKVIQLTEADRLSRSSVKKNKPPTDITNRDSESVFNSTSQRLTTENNDKPSFTAETTILTSSQPPLSTTITSITTATSSISIETKSPTFTSNHPSINTTGSIRTSPVESIYDNVAFKQNQPTKTCSSLDHKSTDSSLPISTITTFDAVKTENTAPVISSRLQHISTTTISQSDVTTSTTQNDMTTPSAQTKTYTSSPLLRPQTAAALADIANSHQKLTDVQTRKEGNEMERKVKAKRARESRRSTQGVTKEDIQRAEDTLKAAYKKPPSLLEIIQDSTETNEDNYKKVSSETSPENNDRSSSIESKVVTSCMFSSDTKNLTSTLVDDKNNAVVDIHSTATSAPVTSTTTTSTNATTSTATTNTLTAITATTTTTTATTTTTTNDTENKNRKLVTMMSQEDIEESLSRWQQKRMIMNEQHSFHASLERRKITPSDSDRASTEGITKETTKDDIKTGNALVKDNIEPPEKRDKEGLSTGVFDGMKLLNKKNDTVTLYKKMSDFTSTVSKGSGNMTEETGEEDEWVSRGSSRSRRKRENRRGTGKICSSLDSVLDEPDSPLTLLPSPPSKTLPTTTENLISSTTNNACNSSSFSIITNSIGDSISSTSSESKIMKSASPTATTPSSPLLTTTSSTTRSSTLSAATATKLSSLSSYYSNCSQQQPATSQPSCHLQPTSPDKSLTKPKDTSLSWQQQLKNQYLDVVINDSPASFISSEPNYKKMWEEEQSINQRLQSRISQLENDLSNTQKRLDGANLVKPLPKNSENFTLQDKQELERVIEDLKEKLKDKNSLESKFSRKEAENSEIQKTLENLKRENTKLKNENGALIRVIGKLSK